LAQAIPIDPPPLPEPLPFLIDEVQIEAFTVDVTIDGALAKVHVTQRLRNDLPRTIEGSYLFPLPADAALSDFQMTVDGKVLEGEILRADEARRTYEEIVRQRRDPALLEYIGQNLLRISVFPIPAGATRVLEFSYVQLLTSREGLYQFRFPVQVGQSNQTTVEAFALNLDLINQPGLRTIYSTSHDLTIERTSNTSAQVSYTVAGLQAGHLQAKGDFVLYFGNDQSAVGLNLLSYQPAGEDGFFVLLAAPELTTSAEAIVARDLVMVLDVSGSMQGEKIAQAQAAAHYVVDSLNPTDRFNLITFSTGVQQWENALQEVDDETREAAHAWIDGIRATGGTDINRGLLEALAQFTGDEARPAYVLFLTDGLPTQGERKIDRILANVMANLPDAQQLRLFTFGVGYDVNTTLLDALSADLGGRSSYVSPEERIDEEISYFYNSISTPVLSDVNLTFTGDIVVDEIYPAQLPDLFAGEQLLVTGRYHGGHRATVTLSGVANGEALRYQYPNQALAQQGGEAAVARLWAARKIGTLLQQIRREGPDEELIAAIVDLGLQYGIVTPYTSAFVPEPGTETANGGVPRPGEDVQPLAAPAQLYDSYRATAATAAATMTESSGETAVKMSEEIGVLNSATVVEADTTVNYVAGKSFVNQGQIEDRQKNRLTLWVDLLYNERMQVETVQFGSACYFALLEEPGLAAWLALSPELIIVRDANHALRITTLNDDGSPGANAIGTPSAPTATQDAQCPTWESGTP